MRFILVLLGLWGVFSYLRGRRQQQKPRALITDGRSKRKPPHIVYEIVEHDGGWAYKVGDVFSETHPTRREAVIAAQNAAEAHEMSGEDSFIEYQDERGRWHEEIESGDDRPEVDVENQTMASSR
ncbi:hypothetical protein GCM10011385_38670 [Nitratireductor aestuarii]|uniref:DUF2188 domain-containing protein n=1 Tax=Nitratireductor aestuarii TaxID=1735103 RepID=A0A916S390_9HYPH|nr:DUF2188 domain-containing protein [Nitratireductor aestuarii]GGA80675.1 hypothetical protein GCM10011385_38670 [Nitratireductor aestuarii]